MKKLLLYITIFILLSCSKENNETGTMIRVEANWTGHLVNTGLFADFCLFGIQTYPIMKEWYEKPVGNSWVKEVWTDQPQTSLIGHLLVEGYNHTGTFKMYADNKLVLHDTMYSQNDSLHNFTLITVSAIWKKP